jgi:hypothetical protein
LHALARALNDHAAKCESLSLENSTLRAREQNAPKEKSYQDRSEFERLKHADVSQGKRIAELLAKCERYGRVVEAAVKWKKVADDPGAPVWKYTMELDAALDALAADKATSAQHGEGE